MFKRAKSPRENEKKEKSVYESEKDKGSSPYFSHTADTSNRHAPVAHVARALLCALQSTERERAAFAFSVQQQNDDDDVVLRALARVDSCSRALCAAVVVVVVAAAVEASSSSSLRVLHISAVYTRDCHCLSPPIFIFMRSAPPPPAGGAALQQRPITNSRSTFITRIAIRVFLPGSLYAAAAAAAYD